MWPSWLILWPIVLFLARVSVAGPMSSATMVQSVVYPLADLLLLYAMGLYRREAFVEKRHSAVRMPMIVAMGALVGLIVCEAIFSLIPAMHLGRSHRDDVLVAWLAFLGFTICAFVARVVLDMLAAAAVVAAPVAGHWRGNAGLGPVADAEQGRREPELRYRVSA